MVVIRRGPNGPQIGSLGRWLSAIFVIIIILFVILF